jgi:DNA-binding IclR family transcriptional regulator
MPSTVRSAERALEVLELLAQRARPVAAAAIARECGIPRSSTHHLLNVMRDRGFVTYYEDERAWGLGIAAFEVGAAYLRGGPLLRLGRPCLVRLTAATGETSHLAVLSGAEVLYVDKEQPPGDAPRLVTEIGIRLPAHLTAVGRAILADLPEGQVRAIYDGRRLVVRTAAGPASLGALLRGLRAVRGAGYALDEGMTTPGITCVGASVRTPEGLPVAAVGVTFVAAQRSPQEVEQAAAEVRRAASDLGRALAGGLRDGNGA